MSFKSIIFFAFCLAVASASVLGPIIVGQEDGSFWRGKYDIREFHAALPSIPGGVAVLPLAIARDGLH